MTFTIDPNLLENNEFELTEDQNGNLALEAKNQGYVFTIDENSSLSDKIESQLDENLNANGNDINNVGSLNTGNIDIGQTTIVSNTVTLSDDGSESFDFQGDTMAHIFGDVGGTSAIVATRFDGIGDVLANGAKYNIESGALSGTTGQDGRINISRVENTFYIENRDGQEIEFDFLIYNR